MGLWTKAFLRVLTTTGGKTLMIQSPNSQAGHGSPTSVSVTVSTLARWIKERLPAAVYTLRWRRCTTYMAHEGFKVNAYLCQEATARLCGCGRCGLVTNSSCPDFRTWQKSRNNIWYTERCYSVAIAQTQTVL